MGTKSQNQIQELFEVKLNGETVETHTNIYKAQARASQIGGILSRCGRVWNGTSWIPEPTGELAKTMFVQCRGTGWN